MQTQGAGANTKQATLLPKSLKNELKATTRGATTHQNKRKYKQGGNRHMDELNTGRQGRN